MTADMPIRVPPHNLRAEQALLGAILMDNRAFDGAGDFLKPEHFAEPIHGRIFDACARLIGAGRRADPVKLKAMMAADEGLAQIGGDKYLISLAAGAVGLRAADDYARMIFDMHKRREMIAIFEDGIEAAYDIQPDRTADSEQEEVEQRLFRLAGEGASIGGPIAFRDAIRGALSGAEAVYKADGKLRGLTTGLTDLDRRLGGLHPTDLLILAGRPSMGKAQPLDAKILLADGGWRRMGEIAFGDHLASIDGAPSMVSGVFPQGSKRVYRITFRDGRSTRACAEHLWQVESCKFSTSKIVSTAEIAEMLTKERYQGRLSVPMVCGHFGKDDGILIDPWLMGVILGNGHIGAAKLSISTADAATLFRVQQVVGAHRVAISNDSGYDYRINQCGDTDLVDALGAYGLKATTSPEKFVPAPYLAASRNTRIELLRGLLDTDGWVETFGAVRFATTSERLANDVQALVRSLGGACTIARKSPTFTHKGEKRTGLPAFTCNITHPDRASLLTLTRKQRRCKTGARFRQLTIASVEPDGFEDVQCIKVTHPSSLYVTDDYIVTHNTALALNITANAAEHLQTAQKKSVVAFFSLEMSGEQLAGRDMARESGVSSHKIRNGPLTASDMEALAEATMRRENLPLYVDDTPALSVAAIRTRSRRLAKKHGLALIVIDYLQLIGQTQDRSRRRAENRTQELSEITAALKALAKELNVPVLALSQLSRQVEQREDKRPQLSDLRESGSIEQDADAVMFVFREQYYLERAEPGRRPEESDEKFNTRHAHWEAALAACVNTGEVIIAKQRHGPIGSVRLHFNPDLVTFGNLDQGGGSEHWSD